MTKKRKLEVVGRQLSEDHWTSEEEVITIHRGHTPFGTIEIEPRGSVFCGTSDKVWPLLKWTARGDGFTVAGTARSLGRAKEDARAALELLSVRDFETSTPRDEERKRNGQ